ncbi:MAG: hypothetical protein INF92_18505 [Rhodobacter sp.]|nr:hypothetical protein [Rhodobacter sp.]
MGCFPKLLLILPILLSTPAAHADGDMQPIGRFAIDRTEVSVGAFRRFVSVTGMVTMAERQGGGSVFEAGWVFKPGWTWSTPFGEPADEIPSGPASVFFIFRRGARLRFFGAPPRAPAVW